MQTGRTGRWVAAWWGAWLAVAVLCAPPGAAAEDTTTEARDLFLEGVKMADEQRWSEAVQYFRQSRALMDRDSTVFNLAVALFRLGRYGESVQAFEDFLGMTEGNARAADAREQARGFVRRAEASLATLILEIAPPEATVSVDGETVDGEGARRELRLDPGSHRLRIEARNHLPQSVRLSLMSSSEASTRVELVPLMGDLDRQAQREESARRAAAAEAAAGGNEGASVAGGDEAATETDEGGRRPLLKSPWFWTAVGVVVVGAGVGLGVGLSGSGGSADPYGGTTGVVLRP
ncbi:MAG: hypothetical protein ACODAU_06595 [Myxococcota bacterium]